MIVDLPVIYPEIGRLRLGEQVAATNGRTRPVRASCWIASSNDLDVLRAVSGTYGGGAPEVWPAGPDRWRVRTETEAVDVLIPPEPLSVHYEAWTAAGCQRRCDGRTATVAVLAEPGGRPGSLADQECVCHARGWAPGRGTVKEACDLVVRLRVILPDIPGLGIWVMTSGSFYAAAELPAPVSLLAQLGAGGALVPAQLVIDQRTARKPWEPAPRQFGVPVLRVRQSMTEIARLARAQLGAAEPPAAVVEAPLVAVKPPAAKPP
ncbi:MAG: hypothetical protein ACRD0D_06945, partial [Acidimicrobiales bacterium]